MSDSRDPTAEAVETGASGAPAELVWHELECGGYRADLPLWRELAEAGDGPVLDIGAGSGRVSLDLAGRGHDVTALDLSSVLLGAIRSSAGKRPVEAARADARSFALARKDYGLCIVPMQTVQLLEGASGRSAFLHRAREHLRPGALLACALIGELDEFDVAEGDLGPPPETVRVEGMLYVSRATRVARSGRRVVIERERRIVSEQGRGASATEGPEAVERDVIELDDVSASQLEREALAAGLSPEPAREVAPTDDHVGSVVVVLRA